MRAILVAGVLTAMGVIDANATMPVLGDKPASLNLSTCEAWAKRQDADAIEMWGIQEDGVASHDLGIHRLVSECMGDGTPDIVYSQSSAGSHEEFCGTHQTIGLCGGKTEPAMPSDYRGAWTESAQGCSKKLSVGDLGPNEYVFEKGRRLNFEGTCKIVRASKAGLSSWEIDEVCGLNGSSARAKAHWSLSVAGNSMVAVISRPGSKPTAPFNLTRCSFGGK